MLSDSFFVLLELVFALGEFFIFLGDFLLEG